MDRLFEEYGDDPRLRARVECDENDDDARSLLQCLKTACWQYCPTFKEVAQTAGVTRALAKEVHDASTAAIPRLGMEEWERLFVDDVDTKVPEDGTEEPAQVMLENPVTPGTPLIGVLDRVALEAAIWTDAVDRDGVDGEHVRELKQSFETAMTTFGNLGWALHRRGVV